MARPVLPDVYVEIRDGGLGLAPGRLEGIHVKVGVASDGPEEQVTFLGSQREAIRKYGSGPLVDACVDSFSSGSQIVYAVRAKASIPGIIGGVYGLWVEVTRPGSLGVAHCRYSLDGGVSWRNEVAIPGTGVLEIPGRKLTLTFTSSESDPAFVGGDLWKFEVNTGTGKVTPGSKEVTGNFELAVQAVKTAVVVTKTGTGDMTPSGAPLVNAEVLVQIVDDGELNAATFRYSLDGGDNWSPKRTVPPEFDGNGKGKTSIPGTGIELEFSKGDSGVSFVAGDVWEFRASAPRMSNGDLIRALELLYETNLEYEFIHVVGESGRPVWAACGAMADKMFNRHRYIFFLCESRGRNTKETVDEWVGSLIDDAAKFTHWRVSVVAGRLELVDMNTGHQVDRNGAGVVAGLVSKNPVQRSIGYVMYNPVVLGLELNPYPQLSEAHIQALDAARYTTFRRYVGLRGIYVTNGRMMAEDISDYRYIEAVRTINRACRLVRTALLAYEHGEADEAGLKYLLARGQQPLLQMQKDREIIDFRVAIPKEQDLWSTSEVMVEVAVVPVPIMRWIKIAIGYENPILRKLLEKGR